MKESWLKVAVIISGGLLALCVCASACLVGGGYALIKAYETNPELEAILYEMLFTPTPTPVPVIVQSPIPPTPTPRPDSGEMEATPAPVVSDGPPTLDTEELLMSVEVPMRDQRLLAERLKHGGMQIPEVVNEAPPDYHVGDTLTFWVTDNSTDTPSNFQTTATLQYATEHSYWWVEDGYHVDEEDLRASAELFESETYPTNRAFFGSEWSPGVDNDVHVHIFNGNVPGVGGYYSSADEYSTMVNEYSNEKEMFYINIADSQPGTSSYDAVLAHEFQHMIHWYQDRNEDTWVNEGLSEVATYLNGLNIRTLENYFLREPDTQLTTWADDPFQTATNYGSSYLFMMYILERFGEDMTRDIVAESDNGIDGFNNVFKRDGLEVTFKDVFADWVVANYLDDTTLDDGHWGYDNLDPRAGDVEKVPGYPFTLQTTVHQYGTDYVSLDVEGPLTIEFTGSTRVKLADNDAHSGRLQWWANRGDDSNTTLTRLFDLSGIDEGAPLTLVAWMWYDIEDDWDYLYFEVSTDGGRTWDILRGPKASVTNPSGNAFGPGYTGESGGWVEEAIDLGEYAGMDEVLLRFEYVTDDAVNRPGFFLDDVSMPELGYSTDFEEGADGWAADGFVLLENTLNQHFIVQVIEKGRAGTHVRRMELDDLNHGEMTVGDGVKEAVLLVSGVTNFTTEPASYEYTVKE